MSGENIKIAYLHVQFPKLSETFVWREVEALEGLGIDIKNISLKRSFLNELNDENRRFASETTYLPHFMSGGMIYSHLWLMFRRPMEYFRTAFRLFTSRYPPGNMWLGIRKPLIFWRAVHLARLIDDDKTIRHIHAPFKYVGLVAWIVNRLTGRSYSFSSHFATNALMVGRVAADATFVATSSEREFEIIKSAMPTGATTPVRIVRLGLPEEYFADTAASKKSDVPTIISVGRFIPKKGFILLMRALGELTRRSVDFKAVIVGDGPMKGDILSQAARFGLEDRVTFTGYLEPVRLRDALDSSDIFSLFCTYGPDGDVDGVPASMIEAMARGLPTVTTRISALPELIEDGEVGYLVPPGDVTAFADALEKLIKNKPLREKMGDKARAKARRESRLSRQAGEMKELFETAVRKDNR